MLLISAVSSFRIIIFSIFLIYCFAEKTVKTSSSTIYKAVSIIAHEGPRVDLGHYQTRRMLEHEVLEEISRAESLRTAHLIN